MLFSKTSEYGFRAILYLAIYPERQFIPIREIADELGISFHFLGKIFQSLTQNGLVKSYKGPNGGVALAENPRNIYPIDVIRAIDGLNLLHKCAVGLNECSDKNPCPLHNQWIKIRHEIYRMSSSVSLSFDQLAKDTKRHKLRIKNKI